MVMAVIRCGLVAMKEKWKMNRTQILSLILSALDGNDTNVEEVCFEKNSIVLNSKIFLQPEYITKHAFIHKNAQHYGIA